VSVGAAFDQWEAAEVLSLSEAQPIPESLSQALDWEYKQTQKLLRNSRDLDAHRALARLYRDRSDSSEGDEAILWRTKCSWHDLGDQREWLDGLARLGFDSRPSDVNAIGTGPDGSAIQAKTPVQLEGLSPGTWRFELVHGNSRADLYVELPRGGDVQFASSVVLVPNSGAAWCHVPAGPFFYGGDTAADYPIEGEVRWLDGFFIARFPVTLGDYVTFLNSLFQTAPDEALMRVPRRMLGGKIKALLGTKRGVPRPFEVPPVPQGSELCPVIGISYEDAQAYITWRTNNDGITYRLPTEVEWEKAARGVDGRWWPWGSEFDPSKANSRHSHERPTLLPVGAFQGDVSPYGVQDMAGAVLEWCSPGPDPLPTGGFPIRGGSWHSSPQACRVADRFGCGPRFFDGSLGFRLARSESDEIESLSTQESD